MNFYFRQNAFGRQALVSLLAMNVALLSSARSQADECATLAGDTVRWIVPYSAGGGYDTYSRLIEPVLERHLGVEIAVVNMPGAGGMVGAKSIRAEDPDGKTIGLVNASGLLLAQLAGEDDIPSLKNDFAILGRVTRDQSVWLAKSGNDIHFGETGKLESTASPVLFGVTGIASGDWFTISIAKTLLDLDAEFVAGYDGSKETQLGLIRGEFDLMDNSWGSSIAPIENGEMVPIIQIASEQIADHPSLDGIPVIAGPEGLIRQHAIATGADPNTAGNLADGFVGVLEAGRTVVAPAGLPDDLYACLEDNLHRALTDPEFLEAAQKARRPLDVATGREASSSIEAAEAVLPELQTIVGKK